MNTSSSFFYTTILNYFEHISRIFCIKLNKLNENINDSIADMNAVDKAFAMKRELLDQLEAIGDRLPPNTLDQLIDELGGTENVAEVNCFFCASVSHV